MASSKLNDQPWAVNAREDVRVQDPDPNLELNNPNRNEQRNVVSEQQQQLDENKCSRILFGFDFEKTSSL